MSPDFPLGMSPVAHSSVATDGRRTRREGGCPTRNRVSTRKSGRNHHLPRSKGETLSDLRPDGAGRPAGERVQCDFGVAHPWPATQPSSSGSSSPSGCERGALRAYAYGSERWEPDRQAGEVYVGPQTTHGVVSEEPGPGVESVPRSRPKGTPGPGVGAGVGPVTLTPIEQATDWPSAPLTEKVAVYPPGAW